MVFGHRCPEAVLCHGNQRGRFGHRGVDCSERSPPSVETNFKYSLHGHLERFAEPKRVLGNQHLDHSSGMSPKCFGEFVLETTVHATTSATIVP